MATFNKFEQFTEDLAKKVHNLSSDQLKVALTDTSPSASLDLVLADLPTEATYTFCSTRNITTTSCEQTAGVLKLILVDLVLTASGGSVGPFRYVTIYNDTSTSDSLIGYYDRGSSVTLADTETFTIDFSATNGVLTIT